LTARPHFGQVAGNEADMDVDTNTPRNGLHFLATSLFFAALFLGVFVLLTVGMLASMFAQLIEADPTFFHFLFLLFFFP
jgi:hypothetical protein